MKRTLPTAAVVLAVLHVSTAESPRTRLRTCALVKESIRVRRAH